MKFFKVAHLFAIVASLAVSVNAQTATIEEQSVASTVTTVKSMEAQNSSYTLPEGAMDEDSTNALEGDSSPESKVTRKSRSTRGSSRRNVTKTYAPKANQMVKEVPSNWKPIRPASIASMNLEPIRLNNASSSEFSQEEAPADPAPKKADPEPKTESKSALLSVNVSNWELSEVLNSLSVQSGFNIVLVSSLNPKITVKLDDLPFEEALRVISSVANMQVIQLGSGGYVVGSVDTLRTAFPKEFEVQVGRTDATGKVIPATQEDISTYSVKHVTASELATALNNLFTNDGLTVTIGPAKLSPKKLENNDSGLGSTTGGSGSGSGSGSGAGNPASLTGTGRVLILRGPKKTLQMAMKIIKDLDVKRPQVAIKVQIHDISNESLRDLGVQWGESTGTKISENNTGQNDLNFGSFTRSATAFNATIKHLEKTEQAKILAEPNISVLDEESAYILIGDRLNYPVITSFTDAGQPIFDIKEEKVGIYLQVSATVNDENSVTMQLFPQVSTVTGFLEIASQGSYPQISTREAKTSLRTKSGQTVIIGGLLRDEEITNIQKVPLLSQIPFFGELFTHRKKTRNKSQVIISITPTIIQGEP